MPSMYVGRFFWNCLLKLDTPWPTTIPNSTVSELTDEHLWKTEDRMEWLDQDANRISEREEFFASTHLFLGKVIGRIRLGS